MNEEQLVQFEALIHKACAKHLTDGGTIIYGTFWAQPEEKMACPIRLATSIDGLDRSSSYEDTLSSILKFTVSSEEMRQFIRGFDTFYAPPNDEQLLPIFNLGKKLFDQYSPQQIE